MKNEKQKSWMRLGIFIFAALAIGIFVWQMIPQWIQSGFSIEQRIPDNIKFKIFQAHPPFDFTFEYPELWDLRESGIKNQYDLVEILGKKDPENKSVPAFFIFKKPAEKNDKGLRQDWMSERVNQVARLQDFERIEDKEIVFQGNPARKIVYQYKIKLPFRTKNAQDVLFRKELIWIQKDLFWYELIFSSTDEQSKALKPVWKHLLETFQFSPAA